MISNHNYSIPIWYTYFMSLDDMEFPENIERPEMWTPESIVQAVQDGFTFLIPFKMGDPPGSPNGYYILGRQYMTFAVTVGPEHTEITRVLPTGWLEMTLWFPPGMVPDEAFIGEINPNGVGQVWAQIDPQDIDWDQLNRGHQIRIKGGFRYNSWNEEDTYHESLGKRMRRLCRSDLSAYEISDYLDVPASWAYEVCRRERGWRRNPEDRIVYPFNAKVNYICDTCGGPIYPGETCEATCMQTESGSLLAPHEVKCKRCILIDRKY